MVKNQPRSKRSCSSGYVYLKQFLFLVSSLTTAYTLGMLLGFVAFFYTATKFKISFWFFPKWWLVTVISVHAMSIVVMYVVKPKDKKV